MSERLHRLVDRMRRAVVRHGGPWVVLALAAIIAMGFGVRVAGALRDVPNPSPDGLVYLNIADSLYRDGRWGDGNAGAADPLHRLSTAYRDANEMSPGGPLLYAATYFLTGGVHHRAARLVVAVLGALTVFLAYLLGRRLAGAVCSPGRGGRFRHAPEISGLLAATITALYPPFANFTSRDLSEPIAACTLTGAVLSLLWASDRRRVMPWILPGALTGLTALTRPDYLAVAAVFAVLVLVRTWRVSTWRAGALSAAVFAVAVMGPIVPWTVRNYLVLDRFVPVSEGLGRVLYSGTLLPADGDWVKTKVYLIERNQDLRPTDRRGKPVTDAERIDTDIEPLLARVAARYPDAPSDVALRRVGVDNLFHYLESRPLDVAAMMARKVFAMWKAGEGRPMSQSLWRVAHVLVVLLGAVGFLLLAFKRRFEAAVLAVVFVVISGEAALLDAIPRRTLPFFPLVAVLAGVALLWAVDKSCCLPVLRRGRSRRSEPAVRS